MIIKIAGETGFLESYPAAELLARGGQVSIASRANPTPIFEVNHAKTLISS
ncbi:MAG: hypothetical protein WA110_08600 [Anaerolineaceae bacterium]